MNTSAEAVFLSRTHTYYNAGEFERITGIHISKGDGESNYLSRLKPSSCCSPRSTITSYVPFNPGEKFLEEFSISTYYRDFSGGYSWYYTTPRTHTVDVRFIVDGDLTSFEFDIEIIPAKAELPELNQTFCPNCGTEYIA